LVETAKKYGVKSYTFYYEYVDSLEEEKPLYTREEFYLKLKAFINDPIESQKIENNKADEVNNLKEQEKRYQDHNREKLRMYYLYSDLIFQIFDINKEMKKQDIINSIQHKMENADAEKIFKDCNVYLLEKCRWNNNYKISENFAEECFNEDPNILTHEKWLLDRNKILKISHDEIEFEKLRMENYSLWKSRFYPNYFSKEKNE
jgi:hypothetical protein